ncbi:isopentenyl-diphosphate Delta-isomerase [Mucilaginibacter sp. McL0603]|uniref:isopentenyl-diphosphate Delta-isomerase n=1 Tax=Mucilaginibacter sp. McL0603 TaxID=3415670 RepID=UPI003CE6FE1D
MSENVILVDEQDQVIGIMPKMEAHLQGKLHRAFSVFIFNSKGELLLQQRAADKYHSGGKWSNTCCSHPRSGEDTLAAAHRRLFEEMGLKCELNEAFSFIYKVEMDGGLIEHEYDHVYVGLSDVLPVPDPGEVAAYCYQNMTELEEKLISKPDQYSEWLKICFSRVNNTYHLLI